MLKSSGQYLCYRFPLICCRNSDIGKVSVCFCSIRSVSQRIEVQPFGNFLRFSISIGNFKRCGCAVRKSDRVCVHIAVRGSLYNGNNTDSGVTLVTLVTLVAFVALGSGCTGITFVAFFTLGSGCAGVAFVAFFALGSGCAGIAFVAFFALGSGCTGVAFVTFVALGSGCTGVAFVAFFTLGSGCTGVAFVTLRGSLSVFARQRCKPFGECSFKTVVASEFICRLTIRTGFSLFSLFTLDTLRSFHTLAPGQNRYAHEYG